MSAVKKATLSVVAAYLWWGFSPIFWRGLDSLAPTDQLSWRVALGFGCLVAVWSYRRSNPFQNLTREHVVYGVLAAAAIASNWAAFLWAVDNDQTVEAALGYFLMPLVSVALGVGLLGERLRPRQSAALVLASVGMIWTLVVLGKLPWVALVLGFSFSLYGLARKRGPWGAVNGLTFELMLISPVVMVLLVARGLDGHQSVNGDGSPTTLLLIALTGIVTVVPLLLFASATKHVPLSNVGLLQYINPALQFLVGWQLFDETVSTARLIAFGWIWAALVLIVSDEVRSKRPVDRVESGGRERFIRS